MAEIYVPDIGRGFYFTYGHAMASWAGLESTLCSLFTRLTDMRQAIGASVFYSARSFAGRIDMIGACIEHVRTVPDGKHFLSGVVGLAAAYSGTRNRLAHDEHFWEVLEENHEVEITIKRAVTGDKLTEAEIKCADDNFSHLTLTVLASLGRGKLLREPELCLALLKLLPSQATDKPLEVPILNDRLQEIVRS